MREREEAVRVGGDAAAAALRADDRRRPGLGARAAARVARGLHLGAHRHLDALQRVLERDVHLGLEVGAALGLGRALPAEAAARAAAEEAAEEIAEVEVLELRSATAAEGPAPVRRPELVVLRALLGIGEHVVGALDLLELRLVAAAVGVMLARELPVRLLDLLGRRRSWGRPACRTGLPSFGHDHPGRPEHLVAEPVALLQHLEHRALLGALGRLREQRLVDVRVEGALGVDLRQPVPLAAARRASGGRAGRLPPASPPRARPRPRAPARDRRARAGARSRAARSHAPSAPRARARPACGSCRSRRRDAGRRRPEPARVPRGRLLDDLFLLLEALFLDGVLVGHDVFASSSSMTS